MASLRTSTSAPSPPQAVPSALVRGGKVALFFAFAFAVMADPVSSVAYAIEAALRALNGHLDLLLPTMSIVIGIIALVTLNYWQLVRMFPEGGGSPEAAGRAFGEEWSFLPIGALIVDFALTIAISIAAAGSALIAYVPALAPERIPLAMALVALVAGLTWFGHGGRLVFAVMTSLFIVAGVVVLAAGWISPHSTHGDAPITGSASPALVAVILAFPVAMALATGTEAPATSIAQLGQLDNHGRWRFGRGTLGLTILIVGGLTLGLTALAVHLNVGIPGSDSTQIADLAKAAVGDGGLFGFFQLSSSVLLLAAAASSFQAGPGLLKALARTWPDGSPGLLPAALARVNRHHTPVLAVVVYTAISAVDHPRRQRPGAGTRPRLRGRGLRQLPRRPARDGPFLTAAGGAGPVGDQPDRRGGGGVHPGGQSGARLPLDLDRRDGADRRVPSLPLGARRPPAWHRVSRAHG